ncbi:GtrA family protein [Sulfitobacter sp. SBS6]|uniref:GtrA family protein n=1 Tax=Sulfitobacter sp. SBS6 TaxID=3401755 RepID=UPI003AAFF475
MPRRYRKSTRFALVSTGTAMSYVAMYVIFTSLKLPALWANVLAFLFAGILQYIGHVIITFERQVLSRSQIEKFMAMAAIGCIVSSALAVVLSASMGFPAWMTASIIAFYMAAQNYTIMSLWAFGAYRAKLDATH